MHYSMIRHYAAMSGDPGRHHKKRGGFFKHALRVPRAIRKFHPTGLLKTGLLAAATLPFGGAGLAGLALRSGGGLARRAISGVRALRGGGAMRSVGRSGGFSRGVQSAVSEIADAYGVDPDELLAQAEDEGVLEEEDEGDIYEGDYMGDYYGDPGPRVRSRVPKHRASNRATRTHSTHGRTSSPRHKSSARRHPAMAGTGGQAAALAELAAQMGGGLGAGGVIKRDKHGRAMGKKRRHVIDVTALNRASARLAKFERLQGRIQKRLKKSLGKFVHHESHSRGHGGHKPGCGCVACRHRK